MAHHTNENGEYKTKSKLLKFYPSDFYSAKKKSEGLNMNLTEYMTSCIVGSNITKTHVFKANKQTYRSMTRIAKELNKIGNNINQIARVFNLERKEGGSVPPNYPLPEELTALRQHLMEVKRELDSVRNSLIGR